VAARKHLPKAKLLTFPTEAACVLEVVQGRADAFVYDEWQIREHARLNPGRTRVLDAFRRVEPHGSSSVATTPRPRRGSTSRAR
jgi:ABC-type amino acid transport substrate-binding protein